MQVLYIILFMGNRKATDTVHIDLMSKVLRMCFSNPNYCLKKRKLKLVHFTLDEKDKNCDGLNHRQIFYKTRINVNLTRLSQYHIPLDDRGDTRHLLFSSLVV